MNDLAAGPPEGFVWPEPWEPIPDETFCPEYPCFYFAPAGDEQPATISAELQREAGPGHPLYRVHCRAVARSRRSIHEFVLTTARPWMPVAFVHLIWTAEKDPHFPWVRGYESWGAFRAAWAPDEQA
jgi:hypothetical protein